MSLTVFHLNPLLLLMMKMTTIQFLFHLRKIRAEYRYTLRHSAIEFYKQGI